MANEFDAPADRPHADRPEADPREQHRHELLERLHDAAYEAERETGRREESDEETRRSLIHRMTRAALGFVIIILGIIALPLPGPGILIILVGLALLPFAWAERTVHEIRRRTPGIPEDGRVPTRSWVVMAVMVAAATTFSLLWGHDVAAWVRDI